MLALFAVVLGRGLVATLGEALRGLTLTQPTVSTVTIPSRLDPQLQQRLQQVATLPDGSVSFAVHDLTGGAAAAQAADRQVPAASLFKLPILVEVLKQQRLGLLSSDQSLEITQDDWTDGSGVLQARVGDHLTVRELQQLMIQQSDNIAALVLLDAVGVDNVNATMAAMGLQATQLHDHRRGDPSPNVTSAADMALLMETIGTGQLIDRQTSQDALQLLQLKQANNWLANELPWWVKVAHKWGSLPDSQDDAGLVFTPRGTYAIAVLTQGGRADAATTVIGQISRAAYDSLTP